MTDLMEWCDGLYADEWLTASQCESVTVELLALGWRIREWGNSAHGVPMRTLSYGSGEHVVAAYGYPHPDEPIGATALLAFARRVATHGTPLPVQFDIMLCADPDGAAQNETWINDPTPATYLRHNWHPHYLGLEVDYAFPIDWGPFLQPPRYTPPSGKAPLPESLAIAAWFQRRKPTVVGLMHNEHVSGSYQFLLQRPSRSLVAAFDDSTERYGLYPHAGERPDPGDRWIRARPDILKEVTLAKRERSLRAMVGDLGDQRFVGCVSVSQYLESLQYPVDVITPEIGMWYSDGIGDTDYSAMTRTVQVVRETTRRGPRVVTRGTMTYPDGSNHEVCYCIEPDDQHRVQGTMTVPVTRGMLGVEAVELRRWWLGQADLVWEHAQPQLTERTQRRQEREAIGVPANRVKDRAMLIFRTAEQYRQPARWAHVADFHARWGFHTARLLGWNLQLYREAGLRDASDQQAALLLGCEQRLPTLVPVAPQAAVQSVIARWLLTAQERITEA
jgi:hypothetical protein